MSFEDFAAQVRQSRFDFTEDQIVTMRNSISELYKVFKFVFDSPRKLQKPYTSLEEYKFKRERLLQSPSDFYNFRDDTVEIKIWKRRGSVYSIAVFGDFIPDSINFDAYTGHEKEFSQGFMFYGRFTVKEFSTCVTVFNYTVKQYIQKKQDSEALF